MTGGWNGGDLAAGDAAWRAWNRLGVSAWDCLTGGGPAMLDDLADAMAPELDRVTRLVLDELEVRLYGEARERVVAAVRSGMQHHAMWAIVEGIRQELIRPDAVPFVPPPVGSWVRSRYERDAQWNGLWHRFMGDLTSSRRVNEVGGRSQCGWDIPLRSAVHDHAVADQRPEVDACGRCSRIGR